MGNSLRLGKVFGIPIYLHYSWFLIFVILTVSIAIYFLQSYPLGIRIVGGVATSLLFFASVLAHELSHSLVAIKNDIPIKSITLFILGGVAQITREATKPRTELLMAIAGPLCSLVLAGIFGAIWFLLWGNVEESALNPLWWLASINLMLAAFNMLPGFPLDGGRILRALLWRSTGDYRRATYIASLIGRGVAYLLVIGGVVAMILAGELLFGLMLVFIGWFLHNAATTSYKQVAIRDTLRGFTAQSVMTTSYLIVPPNLNLRELVQSYVLLTGRHYFVIAEEGRLKGVVTSQDVERVPRTEWDIIPVSEVMTPVDKVVSVRPDEEALRVMELMDEHGESQIPVAKDGIIMSIISRDNLLYSARLRSELGVQR
jgi:Zn-dependent protease